MPCAFCFVEGFVFFVFALDAGVTVSEFAECGDSYAFACLKSGDCVA